MLKVNDISVSIKADNNYMIKKKISKKLGVDIDSICNVVVLKKSQDRRQKNNILNVYSVAFNLKDKNENDYLGKGVTKYEEEKYDLPKVNAKKKVAVIGFGPCGMYASLLLSQLGLEPHVFERGVDADKRLLAINNLKENGVFDEKANVQFGEGGAGTFSDGKLNTNVKDKRIKYIFEQFVKHGADDSILKSNKPHIGTDYLVKIVKSMRGYIISKGGRVNFDSKFVDFEVDETTNEIKNISILHNDSEIKKYEFDYYIFALGHSARDTFYKLYDKGVDMTSKPFSLGFRIEHKREFINECQYGDSYEKIKEMGEVTSAEYKINTKLDNGRGVYTFCMCPGGEVVPAMSEQNTVVTNGMSYFSRMEENSNSAVLVNVDDADFDELVSADVPKALRGIEFQRHFEKLAYTIGGSNLNAPVQKTSDYINNVLGDLGEVVPSYRPGVTIVNFNEHLPETLNDSLKTGLIKLNNKIKGFTDNDSVLTGFETRSSSPVKIMRDEKMFSQYKNTIFAGEGSGYAGGITSSCLEGIKAVTAICDRINEEFDEKQ